MTRLELSNRVIAIRNERAGDAIVFKLLTDVARRLESEWVTIAARMVLAQMAIRLFADPNRDVSDKELRDLVSAIQSCLAQEQTAKAMRRAGPCEFCPADGSGCIVCGGLS